MARGAKTATTAADATSTRSTGFRPEAGFAVALDPERYSHPVRVGEFWWDGSAGTRFWIDPVEQLIVVVNAQISLAGGGGFREAFRTAVEEALVVRYGGCASSPIPTASTGWSRPPMWSHAPALRRPAAATLRY